MTRLFTTALHFCILFFAATSAFAASKPIHDKIYPCNVDICEAPPPDSFRITKIGVDFISLAWKPVWPGAGHQIDVSIENNVGGWNSLFSINIASAASKTVDNLETGKKYRFKIATKCNDGDPSSLTALVDGITLIVELTISGRTPVNPTPINCQGINLLDPEYQWVGYRISWVKQGKVFSSLFELKQEGGDVASNNNGTKLLIKRVDLDNPVVTADHKKSWPTFFNQFVPIFKEAKIGEMSSYGILFYEIGNLKVSYSPSFSIVDICVDKGSFWDTYYLYEPLAAKSVEEQKPQKNSSNRYFGANFEQIRAQSPFNDALKIFFPENWTNSGLLNIQLINANGQIAFKNSYEESVSQVVIPSGSFIPGLYLLRIEAEGEVHYLKVIKIE